MPIASARSPAVVVSYPFFAKYRTAAAAASTATESLREEGVDPVCSLEDALSGSVAPGGTEKLMERT
jgi:hypothetical protein